MGGFLLPKQEVKNPYKLNTSLGLRTSRKPEWRWCLAQGAAPAVLGQTGWSCNVYPT